MITQKVIRVNALAGKKSENVDKAPTGIIWIIRCGPVWRAHPLIRRSVKLYYVYQ